MADRRKGDRREEERGVVRIELKKIVIYGIIVAIVIGSIILNFVLGTLYAEYKNKYEEISNQTAAFNVEEDNSYVTDDYVEHSCNLILKADKQQVKSGEVITYEITASNIKAENGVISFEALLDYDTNVFECEVVNDENSQWEVISPSNNYLSLGRKDLLPSKEDQVIAKIAVKVKENAKSGQYELNLIGPKFTMENNSTFVISDETIEINVE